MHHSSPPSTPSRGTPSRRGKSPKFASPSSALAGPSSLSLDIPHKPSPTFYSCLSIPVQGAVPIEPETDNVVSGPTEPSDGDLKRAPRKSKLDAMAVLTSKDREGSPDIDDTEPRDILADQYRNVAPIPVSSVFDLSTVKTSSNYIPRSPVPRPFGLEHCPEFFPTAEEFKDPMAYVRSISDKAKEYGICKVIPPEGWKMPFVTDTESFRFKTRVQRLNSIEASSRAKLNFLEQLYRFHSQQGNSRVVVPTINHKPLDLWLLRKEVQRLGGYDAVTKAKKWSDLGRVLGYRGIPGLSSQIKSSYARVILPYEHFCQRARNSPSIAATLLRDNSANKTNPSTPTNRRMSRLGSSVLNGGDPSGDPSGPPSPLTASSSPLSEPPEEIDSKEGIIKSPGRPRRSARVDSDPAPVGSNGMIPTPIVPAPIFYDKKEKVGFEQHCEICGKKNRGEEMLLCDGCDCGFHMFCLDPPLDVIPKDQWFCYACLSGTGGDFGFDEGHEHSLSSFQARDLEFRRMWFESHPPPAQPHIAPDDPTVNRFGNVSVTEHDVENEFWRLVQSPHETVEIEYGADVHSMTHGSAMPTMETHPRDPYSKDPWNLNNIPIVQDSLLRFIKSDISGMTVPWTYVGMAFSTFCWHNEDHYTYSINFMHWGETKTWYGIPGDDAEKFEAAIKREAPDLFEAQPDLLFQLVTLMNPKRLTDAGVRVYGCNQRAGEFVITYPKSYHAGFNHGLNFNEAVNFALPDWLAYGRDCVQRYREHRKLPVFSHDELLITITQQSSSIKTAMWLIDSLKEMIERELSERRKTRAQGIAEVLEEQDRSEEQYQCKICKVFCYLSQVTCPCNVHVACVDHANLLCPEKPLEHVTLRKRFSDDDLIDIQAKVAERAVVPAAWQSKLSKTLFESARPPLRTLRAILAEGERINYPMPALSTLRKFVTRANEWVDAANAFTTRKPSRKRTRRSKGRSSILDIADDGGDKPQGLNELYSLIQDVETLGFDSPEISALRTLGQQAEDMKVEARVLLTSAAAGEKDEAFLNKCKLLLLDGQSLNVMLDELQEVEKIVDREQLIQEVQERMDDEDTMTLDDVRHFLTRGRACNLPADNPHMKLLEARQRDGDNWEEKAKSILAQPIKTIAELEDFADMDSAIPIDPTTLDRLLAARAKAKDFEKQAKAWLLPDPDAARPRPQEVIRLVARAEKDFSIQSVQELKAAALIAVDLEARCETVLKSRYQKGEGEVIFTTIQAWKEYAHNHLRNFTLPLFDKLDGQVKQHNLWLRELPWWCAQHSAAHDEDILRDVYDATHPDDDRPPTDEFITCICTAPVKPPPPGAVSDAVQCDHCYARFHGECAKNGGSCPFCDHHHWNGEIRKERSFHFCYIPPLMRDAPDISRSYSEEFKHLEIIVHRVDHLSGAIGKFLSLTSQPANQRPDLLPQVRHFMRKLYKLQFAVSPNPDVSYGLDLAGLHRIIAGRPTTARPKKRRRPRFTFGQDVDQDWLDGSRCICRGRANHLQNYPLVGCDTCSRRYHISCVFFPTATYPRPYTCPVCCLRKSKVYPYSDVRVNPPTDNLGPGVFVDTKRMLDTFSKELILLTLDPPQQSTLFVDLIKFTPGQPDNGLHGASVTPPGSAKQLPPQPHPHSTARPHPIAYDGPYRSSTSPGALPPPPWSNTPWKPWSGPTSVPDHRGHPPTMIASKKRRIDQVEEHESLVPSSSGSFHKRHAHGHDEPIYLPPVHGRPHAHSQSPGLPPIVQTLSPSLAKIMSPPHDNRTIYLTSPRTSPTTHQARLNNGHA